ncbi:MAG TPA: FtsX-like permease family protein [Candidatus Saccharimonadales bacterium]
MYRLGLQLALKGGKEALTRLLLTALAVAVGTIVLLSVLADFHAYQKTSNRPSWESTTGSDLGSIQGQIPQNVNALLWNYSENIYKGRFIEQLGIASLGSNPPMLPGISKLPGAGEYYASPALAALLKTVPKDELGNRFPGKEIGTIGESGLSFPTELAIYVGYAPKELAAMPGTIGVTHIATATQLQGTTNIYREAFAIAAIAILFPLLILINTATRLSASRREERYAAMRLVGATPRQINVVASVDAIVGALLGTLIGTAIFLLVRPAIADISFSGVKFFSNYVTPTVWGYLGMIIGVPVVAAVASLFSLRRIKISPLGVSRKSASPKPRAWRLIPLAVGVPLFIVGAAHTAQQSGGPGIISIAFLLIMIGLVLSGSWLVMQTTKLLAKLTRNASSLLAARHLADNPKGAFRSISGLVLAVFVGSFVAVLVPAVNAAQSPTTGQSLSNVLRVPYNTSPTGEGISAADGAALVAKLRSYPDAIVLPIYANPAFIAFQSTWLKAQAAAAGSPGTPQHKIGGAPGHSPTSTSPPNDAIADCSTLKQLGAIGTCAAGAKAVTFSSSDVLGGDNPLEIYKSLPVVTSASPATSANLSTLELAGLLVKTNNANTLEKIRTYLTTYDATLQGASHGSGDLTAWQMGVFEPETIGEVAAIRNNDDDNVERAVLAIVALTLITAGCSLAVTVGGSLVERKRPFTLLRVSGVSLATLYRVILLEAALPLVIVSAIAAGLGIGVGMPVIRSLLRSIEPAGVSYPVHPSAAYYLALGIGLVVSLGLVVATLPLLKRITKPEDARFE